MLPPTIANTADRDTRASLEQARNDLTEEHLNPLHLDAVHSVQRAVPELDADTYFHLYRDRFNYDLEGLAAQCRSLLDSTERLYEDSMDRRSASAWASGSPRRSASTSAASSAAPAGTRRSPPTGCCPRYEGTLSNLGIDLDAQSNVHLDVEERPTKRPRAFCAPIEIPGKVMLVIQPQGGPDDWCALFHEAGHTEHFAFTSPDLKVEEKRLGDNAVTEGWAMLLEHLTDDRAWLTRLLDFPRPDAVRDRGRRRAPLLRPPLLREAALRARVPRRDGPDAAPQPLRRDPRRRAQDRAEPDGLPGRHRHGLLRHVVPALLGVRGADPRRSCARSSATTGSRAARPALLLPELWSLGQKPTADELLEDVTGATVEMEAIAEQVRAAIPTTAG